jgi:small subunit ribosomal protein S27Ae
MGRKEKKVKKKGKRARKGRKHETIKGNAVYTVKGEAEVSRSKKACPRCGPGTWLAGHKGRLYCGRCAYTEFDRKEEPKEAPKEEKPAEKPKEEPKEEKEPEKEE